MTVPITLRGGIILFYYCYVQDLDKAFHIDRLYWHGRLNDNIMCARMTLQQGADQQQPKGQQWLRVLHSNRITHLY